MLIKKTNGTARTGHLARLAPALAGSALDRRSFLRRSGLAAGGVGAAPGEAAAPAKPETGYRETAHVRKFYETARF